MMRLTAHFRQPNMQGVFPFLKRKAWSMEFEDCKRIHRDFSSWMLAGAVAFLLMTVVSAGLRERNLYESKESADAVANRIDR